jgi:hypothetical protein
LQPYGENVLIGTTVNTGYKVQITSSTADNQLNVWGASAPSIRIDNAGSAATQRFVIGLATATNNFIQGAAAGQFCISTQSSGAMLFGMWQTTNATEAMRISTANNLIVGSSTDAGFRLDVNGTARITGAVTNVSGGFLHSSTTSTNDAFYTSLSSNIRFYVNAGGYCKSTSNIVSDTNGATSLNASAILQADSTTKGFLPPRMTTTEKNAISSPAAGLIVYDTTLNKLCVRTASTWETITSL